MLSMASASARSVRRAVRSFDFPVSFILAAFMVRALPTRGGQQGVCHQNADLLVTSAAPSAMGEISPDASPREARDRLDSARVSERWLG